MQTLERQDKAAVCTDKELWAVALWIEEHRGEDGPIYIAEQMTRFARVADIDAIEVWRKVADRYDALREPRALC